MNMGEILKCPPRPHFFFFLGVFCRDVSVRDVVQLHGGRGVHGPRHAAAECRRGVRGGQGLHHPGGHRRLPLRAEQRTSANSARVAPASRLRSRCKTRGAPIDKRPASKYCKSNTRVGLSRERFGTLSPAAIKDSRMSLELLRANE